MKLVILAILLSISVLGYSLSDQGTDVKVSATGGSVLTGNLTIIISDAMTGGNILYNYTFNNSIENGSWNVMLGADVGPALILNYSETYYKDYKINGEDVDFINGTGQTVERQQFSSPMGSVNASKYFTQNSLNQSEILTKINGSATNATKHTDINCSEIMFDTGKGNTAICDGLDATGSGGNSSAEMIRGVNGTALNASNFFEYPTLTIRQAVNNTAINASSFFDYLWTSLVGRLITGVDNTTVYVNGTGILSVNMTTINATINALENNTWNTTSEIMTAANSTGLLKNWSYVDTDTDTWNTTLQMQKAANNSANINASGFFGYLHRNTIGLLNDTHTQYLLANGSRSLSGNWDVGGYVISHVSELNITGNVNMSSATIFGNVNITGISYLTEINLSGNLNMSGDICLSGKCLDSWDGVNVTNTTNQSFYITFSNTGNADYVCASGTDCAVSINDAIDSLSSTGGTILFNMGNYTLNQTVKARHIGITFMCSAFGGGRYSSGNSCLFTAEKNMTGQNMFNISNRRIHFKGLVLDGQDRTQHGIAQINGTLQGNGLAGSNHFEDLHIKRQGESGIYSTNEIGPANEYERVITSHNGKHGMELRRNDNRIISYYSYRNPNGAALMLNNGGGTQMTNSHTFVNEWGIYLNGTDNFHCIGCEIEQNNMSAIYFDTTHSTVERISIIGGIFYDNNYGSENRPVFTLNVTSGNDIRNVTFAGNVFDDTADIFEFDGTATDIKNVQFTSNVGRTDWGEIPPSLYVFQLMDDGTVYTENLAYRGLNVSGSINSTDGNFTDLEATDLNITGIYYQRNGSGTGCIRMDPNNMIFGTC